MFSVCAKDSMLEFLLKKADYKLRCAFSSYKVPSEYQYYRELLSRDGVVVFPEYFTPEQVAKFQQEIDRAKELDHVDRMKNGHIDTGISRVYDVMEVAPSTRQIFNDPLVLNVIRGYCSSKCELLKTFYEEKTEVGVSSQSNQMHFDDWRHRVKVWVYLTDVDERNAPTVILKGSHKNHWWRYWPEYNYYLHFRTNEEGNYTELTDYSGMFWPHEIETIKKNWGYEEMTVTGKKGTMFIFDSRALHRSSVLQEGERRIVTGYYTYKGLGL